MGAVFVSGDNEQNRSRLVILSSSNDLDDDIEKSRCVMMT